MNRRSVFKMLASLPFVSLPALASVPTLSQVTVLEVLSDTTKYRLLKEFSTEEEAIVFVQSLIPELFEVRHRDVVPDTFDINMNNSVRSGYRGAIRMFLDTQSEIVSTSWGIRSTLTNEWIDLRIDGFDIYNCEFAWLLISNIRVNGNPVHLKGTTSKHGLPNLLLMPFKKGNPTMTKLEDREI